jgi:hypothetical protein
MAVNFDEVVKLAEQLNPAQQNVLIYRLRMKQAEQQAAALEYANRGTPISEDYRSPTRAELIAELDQLRTAGAFANGESLYGKYANPNVPEISEEEFHAQMHVIATEWEQELDEFTSDES